MSKIRVMYITYMLNGVRTMNDVLATSEEDAIAQITYIGGTEASVVFDTQYRD